MSDVGSPKITKEVSVSSFMQLFPRDFLRILPKNWLSYTSPSGESVTVDADMKEWAAMGLAAGASAKECKSAFRKLIRASKCRQERATVSVAYLLIVNKGLSVVHLMAAMGNTPAVKEVFDLKSTALHAQDELGRTPLYLASRAGFVDMVTYLLSSQRCDLNALQTDGSTALHVSCFYGQGPMAKLLLEAGADASIKNKYSSTAEEECCDDVIKRQLFAKTSAVTTLRQECVGAAVVGAFNDLKYNGKLVGCYAMRPVNVELAAELAKSTLVFHGTKSKHVVSIFKNGLKPSGSTLPDGAEIAPPEGHFKLDTEYAGIKDWARAVFLSPSVTYAAHPAYAEAILDANNIRHRVIVLARVKPGSFKTYSSTVTKYVKMEGEGSGPELRVESTATSAPVALPSRAVESVMPGECSNGEILRVETESNVVVVGLLLLRQSFIDNLPPAITLDSFKVAMLRACGLE